MNMISILNLFNDALIIDSTGSVGAWADLYMSGSKPVISYLNMTQIGIYSGLKLATYIGDESSWMDSDDGEYEVVPSDSAIFNMRTNVVAKSGAAWGDIAIGYASNQFDLVYLKPEEL